MALTTPSLDKVYPYPASNPYDFTFTYSGSSQITQNNLVIQKTSDNTEVYNQIINPQFQFKHTLSGGILTNGTNYKVKIRVGDINNTWSDFSNWVVFDVSNYPTLTIPTIVNGIVNNQNVNFTGTYNKTEGDTLQSYRYLIYDKNSVLIQSYDEKFDGLLEQEVTGLENGVKKHIELRTISVHNMEYSTGLIEFTPNYIQPQLSSTLTVTNLQDQASIEIQAHILQVIGQIGTGSITYENDDWVNLKNGSIYFQEGFSIDGNFTLKMILKNLEENTVFLRILGQQGNIDFKFIDGKIHVYKYTNGIDINDKHVYHIYSAETIFPTNEQAIHIGFQLVGNYCNLTCSII